MVTKKWWHEDIEIKLQLGQSHFDLEATREYFLEEVMFVRTLKMGGVMLSKDES